MLITIGQSTLYLVLMIYLGNVFSKRLGLTMPIVSAWLNSESVSEKVGYVTRAGLLGGLVGGVFIVVFSWLMSPLFPQEFVDVSNNFSPAWYTKILYGGITEEILVRWGLMSFIAWLSFRVTQPSHQAVSAHNYIVGIVLSSLIFGALHLPAMFVLTETINTALIFYIIVGNSVFGLVSGFLFWKRGLECAMLAHISAHIVVIACNLFLVA